MSRGLYSDSFLKALLDTEPNLAKEFLEAVAYSSYVTFGEVVSCLEVPGWVLERAGLGACKNPSFPKDVFENYLKDEDFVAKEIWWLIKSPHLNQVQVDQLMLSADATVRGLALMHPLGDSSRLLDFLKQVLPEYALSTSQLSDIYENAPLTDEIISFLINSPDLFGTRNKLWKNKSLTSEQKALLVLAEIKPDPEKDKPSKDFWENRDLHFISSFPYLQLLDTTFDGDASKRHCFNTIPRLNPLIEAFFTKNGHHLSVVLPDDAEGDIEVTFNGLQELISMKFLHRLFWTDLCERDDFEIFRRNDEETDDLFISHPILGREFLYADRTNATKLGGVFTFDDQKWLVGYQELHAEEAAYELSSNCDESLVQAVEWGNFDSLGESLVALSLTLDDLPEKYGFELTDDAEDWMIEAAKEIADIGSFDVSATLNPDFNEILSWRKLPDSKKEKIFEFLILGYQYKDSKIRNDSVHFLACMALHESTSKTILERLTELGDPLIDEVLASRKFSGAH